MKRNLLVDRLKGYACFLVLFGHVIMGIRVAGIDIPSFFWGLEKFIWSFHVALFLFLSGVVYKVTGEWKGKKTKTGFILYKLYNLGIPYVVFSVVYIAINAIVGQANTQASFGDILNIWKTPVAQYWYLYALFFLFVIWTLLSGYLKNWQITVFALVIGYLTPFSGLSLGSLDVAFYSALAFGVGTFIDFEKLSEPSFAVKLIAIIIHIAAAVFFIIQNKIEAPLIKELMVLLGIYSSIMFISLIQRIKPFSRFLDFVNKYSFQIYLLHTIFTAGIRIVLVRINVTSWVIHIIVGTAVGLICSVAIAKIAEKVKPLNFFFFPSRAFKKTKI